MRHLRPAWALGFACLIVCPVQNIAAENRFDNYNSHIRLVEQQYTINVAIAEDQNQRRKGLMNHTELAENQGMLFVYPDSELRAVWMKNTFLSLDVLFISSDGEILSMHENLTPCVNDPCEIYPSNAPAKYTLEVNTGFIKNHNIKIGQYIEIKGDNINVRY